MMFSCIFSTRNSALATLSTMQSAYSLSHLLGEYIRWWHILLCGSRQRKLGRFFILEDKCRCRSCIVNCTLEFGNVQWISGYTCSCRSPNTGFPEVFPCPAGFARNRGTLFSSCPKRAAFSVSIVALVHPNKLLAISWTPWSIRYSLCRTW